MGPPTELSSRNVPSCASTRRRSLIATTVIALVLIIATRGNLGLSTTSLVDTTDPTPRDDARPLSSTATR